MQFTPQAHRFLPGGHRFDRICPAYGVEHRLTKPAHPWTNGQVERLNRTIKEATVQRFHYQTTEELNEHLQAFLLAYNHAKRLKTLHGLTPHEFVCAQWQKTPTIFTRNPTHLTLGLYSHAVGRYALRTWLRRKGLRALSTRPHRPRTTVADPAAVVAENRLLGQPAPTAPDQVWVGDITYLPLVGGRWCYLATWRDACSRRVVGWHLAAQMPAELVLHALEQALTLRQPAPGLIVHDDRGSQYTNAACRARIAQAGAVPSFSRPGNPYDNAQAEAGWSTLKTELLPQGTTFASLEEARLEVAHYLDTYFNLDRRHSALGYRSPHQFERDLKLNLS